MLGYEPQCENNYAFTKEGDEEEEVWCFAQGPYPAVNECPSSSTGKKSDISIIRIKILGLMTSLLLTTIQKVNQSTENISKETATPTRKLETTARTTSITTASSFFPTDNSTFLPSSTTAALITTTISSITNAALMTTSGTSIEETTPHTFTMTTTATVSIYTKVLYTNVCILVNLCTVNKHNPDRDITYT